MNLAPLIPLLIKYGPLIYAFIQTQGPGIWSFIQEVEDSINGAKNADGSINWRGLLPLAFKYAPEIYTFVQTQGVPFSTIVSDVIGALNGKPVAQSAAIPTPAPTVLLPAATTQGTGPNLQNSGPAGVFKS